LARFEKQLAELENKSNSNNQDQNSKPTPEQEKAAKDKLAEATKSNDKDKIANALNQANETVKNSSDPELKKQKDQAEDKLGEVDKEKLREIIKEEIVKELERFGIKTADLNSENQQKMVELNNNIEPAKIKEIRTELLKDAGIKSPD
jgi:hypothetical protein